MLIGKKFKKFGIQQKKCSVPFGLKLVDPKYFLNLAIFFSNKHERTLTIVQFFSRKSVC